MEARLVTVRALLAGRIVHHYRGAAPIPFDAPVTTATLPFKPLMELLLASASSSSMECLASAKSSREARGWDNGADIPIFATNKIYLHP
jgi:hypothetical protein